MAEEQNNDTKADGVTRRDFLKNSGLVVGGVVGGGLLGGLITNTFMDDGQSVSPTANNSDEPQDAEQLTKARMFFKRAEDFRVLSAAVERIFPEDDIGPGAISLAIPYFIDKQLAGEYGFNSREYMEGPFFEGAPTQGPQTGMRRREVFLYGVSKLQEIAQSEHDESFFDLEGEAQDEILGAFEQGEVDMTGVTSDAFFAMLRSSTLEGAYSDPVYGGNLNMDGWRMKQYPGGQMAFFDVIESEEFVEMEPVSLHAHHT
ncbi:gluconate 2-dehydrogenase subunit 3 family protein [Geomicrobium sp. JCM 19039]|uniref:gluconate 2-dehydrogenase subunit 3 family protein n=1 Tax=Geomicrobium sp. JCM 19039 TaxID=1460636 RepID=UPI00045F2C14|nr:gluconate 2-dehydrogenase subunit 3 family protein [Geomicrobium sp. JCM 19039]GAK11103.1 gluconate 2-dehydrogenase, membrane-bound, gamma subunit [Geomicrobium sp. JCM 19039]